VPVTLSLYLHGLFVKKVQKKFDEHNKVLSQKEIEELSEPEDIYKTLCIFRSAVVDHKEVDGMPYHTIYPTNGLGYHDGFKRAVIADSVTKFSRSLKDIELTEAVLILDKLIDPDFESGYVQILAWHSLGLIGKDHPDLVENMIEKTRNSLSKSVAPVLGALLFLENILQTPHQQAAKNMVYEGLNSAQYGSQKALLNYFIFRNFNFDNPLENPKLENDIKRFLLAIQKGYHFTQEDYNEGLTLIGMVKKDQDPHFWKETPHYDVGNRLNKVCSEYIPVIGAFFNKNYGQHKWPDESNGWTLLTK